ncbi:hypothetical protein H2200_008592 [Cladophialophora chaetospira]|uniref:NTF2-like domain-containing protein n=1 Tax=Cladophialophora chaetospira TaxID=386627 RepID=A0AA38X4B3_9EURO|nr:hypothetical protein H2200_008592 [Cladophialophora chaetospira]
MKLLSLFAPLALVSSITALATPKRGDYCLTQAEAETIVSQYISILSHTPDIATANATAQALLDPNYTETSDSILSLEGQPLGGITFQGKAEYIGGVLGAPPVEGITTIEILVAGTNKIVWYWNFLGIGSGQYEVKGFNLFTIEESGQISAANIEFNSIAWGLDTGYQIIFPPPPSR